MAEKVLVTGGAGYIGSHCVAELIEAGYQPVVVDNCSNAVKGGKNVAESIQRIQKILDTNIEFHDLDLLDRAGLENLFKKVRVTRIKSLRLTENVEVSVPVFHVFGEKKSLKMILSLLLRYFNPIGAHASGMIGEDPQGIPNNLLPYVAQVAVGRRACLNVFGNDYDTIDGTGVRDYIHVVDLAKGHIAALKKLKDNCGCKVYNLGTGKGYSVLQMVKAMEKASGRTIPYKIAPRRGGDVASCYADPQLAEKELGWKAQFDLERMCEDLWRWQSMNPTGFNSTS
uniref:UDP-glucose 4-epimerase n=1 Tax=Nothobranchius furzeri TaxID=105023 RepID=A0A8C6P4R1_NOTFU